MKFYRPVTEEDFDEYYHNKYYFMFSGMSETVKSLCLEDITEAAQLHSTESEKSDFEALQECEIYAKYSEAKKDFDKGIVVYIQY